ncbi:MAG: hypothetical protein IPM83_16620 [Ignavibacteria bacterium]|nr:hypothetical protein [Ignavibacteria bacterium]
MVSDPHHQHPWPRHYRLCNGLCIDDHGKTNFAIVSEDELAAIGMVVGASWNGSRSFTATSGPGLSHERVLRV